MAMPTNDTIKPSEYMAFKEALDGRRGELDAWLECNDEAEVRAMILHHVSARERAAYERAVKKCEEFEDELQTKGRDREADVALGLARRIEALGADK